MNNKGAIYIDSIFLNRALCYAYTLYGKKYLDKFTDKEWDKKINEVNLSTFIRYVIEYGCNIEGEKYNWQNFNNVSEIDVFVFKLDNFYFSYKLYFENPVMYIGQQIINFQIKTVYPKIPDFESINFDKMLAPLIDLHISKTRIPKKYESLCIISIDKYFNPTIERFVKKNFPIMRYNIEKKCNIAGLILEDGIKNDSVFSQDIKYPIARMWGLTSEEI